MNLPFPPFRIPTPSRLMRQFNRRRLMVGLLALGAVINLGRAVHLQVIHKDFLQDQGDERFLREVQVPASRGMILDRHGEPLAVSSPVDSVWAHPPTLQQHQDRVPQLARLLDWETPALKARLERFGEREFVYLRRHLEPELAAQVKAEDIPGIYLEREYRRYYPGAEVSAHLLGFTDVDERGQEGLELAFDDWLKGIPGAKRIIQDRLGRVVENVESLAVPQPGRNLVLSLDRRIQYLAYRALKAAVIEHRAAAASAVVVDVSTGEILALVNQPSANPNDRRQLQPARLRNRAVTDVFEPGSTLKPFTVAVALESGAYTPSTPVDTRPGWLRVGRNRVRDMHDYGLLDVTRVITKSSNVGTSMIALSLPMERMWSLYTRLGFGRPTGIGLGGEQSGVLPHYTTWGEFEYATHSFGYGLSVNLLQLAQAYTVLAADGVRRPLTLLRRDGPADQQQRVISATTARQVRQIMETVVSQEGTARRAVVPGYRVAGKTGTVHKILDGRYAKDRYRALFAGMVPAANPRLVMVVVVDDPRGKHHYGGLVAAPVFSQVMEGALRLLNVPPDQLPGVQVRLAGGEG
ncbi:MAG: penicillin-binding protein 2 [Candidatus Competibacteraceae bacterium]|nr:penicillin-binding protein 2 [Candidatus Competibacteraceae bacterium]